MNHSQNKIGQCSKRIVLFNKESWHDQWQHVNTNAIFYRTSRNNIDKLQRVPNNLARVVKERGKHDHITTLLSQLHWLPIEARIRHTIAGCSSPNTSSWRSLCWRIKFFMGLHRVTLVCSSVCLIYRVSVVSALAALIAWSCHHSNHPLLAAEHLRLLLLRHGTLCQRT